MTTFYLDYEGGNDANAGTSFALRWKTFALGATAARTAPGDTIRVMASPDPTSLGSATWTGTNRPVVGNISSSTNATPIVITTSAAHGLVAGDYVAIVSHTTNTNANGVWKVGTVGSTTTFQILQMDGTNTTGNGVGGATGTFQKATNCIVKLASPLTQNIALCGGLGQKPAWTASANVTCTQNTTAYKEGYSSASIAIAAAFTTGKAAYYTLPATLDLSTYQQVSFWVQQTVGTVGAAGACYIALCSDTVGATVVNTINIPSLGATGLWIPVVVDLGANLGASIQSVAFYVVTDNAAQTFLIDNIVACKASSSADSLNLTSLISKNTAGDPEWYPIESVNYDAVMLTNTNALLPTATNLRGYYGTTETVTTYKRETIKQPPATTNTIQESGTTGSPITYSGGWNRTDMSTQTGQTWWDGQTGSGSGYSTGALSYITTERLNAVRFSVGWNFGSATSNCILTSGYFTGCTTGISLAASNSTIGTAYSNNNSVGYTGASIVAPTVTTIRSNNNLSNGLVVSSTNGAYQSIEANNCGAVAVSFAAGTGNFFGSLVAAYNFGSAISTAFGCFGNVIGSGSTTGNGTPAISCGGSTVLYLNNFTINEATEVAVTFVGTAIYSNRHDNTDSNSWIFYTYGTVNQQNSVVDSPATTSWKMSPTNATGATATYPIKLKLGTIVCGASTLVTITARMQRDNTGLTMRLVCPGGQISGVTSDVYTDMTAAANTWETVTITFTPTKAGAVDIYAYAFGGSTYSGYVCNLTASQA